MTHRSLAALALCSAVAAFACAKAAPEVSEQRLQPLPAAASASASGDPHARLPQLSVEQVASLVRAHQVQPVDANADETRKLYGTLPGALLLSSARSFELSELPADKSTELVFYCGGAGCSSAPRAAARAREAGYTAVKVMSAGITGWVKANEPVDKLGV
jgi:rhodanese-related sulfurtransferase